MPDTDSTGSKIAVAAVVGAAVFLVSWLAAGLDVDLASVIGTGSGAIIGLLLAIRP